MRLSTPDLRWTYNQLLRDHDREPCREGHQSYCVKLLKLPFFVVGNFVLLFYFPCCFIHSLDPIREVRLHIESHVRGELVNLYLQGRLLFNHVS